MNTHVTTQSQFHSIDFWDAAASYAEYIHPFTAAFARDALAEAALAPGARVLDVACGTGALALAAAEAGHSVLATDFSPAMVARTAAHAHPGIETQVMDGQALDLPASGFDAAFSIFGVVLFPDWRAGLAELHRVVRPCGTGVVATWADPGGVALNVLVRDITARLYPELEPPPLTAGLRALHRPDDFAAAMADAGFVDVRVTARTHEFVISVDELAASDHAFGFTARWPQLSETRRAEVRAAVLALAVDGALRVPATALIATARASS